jgi:hypothetical protein
VGFFVDWGDGTTNIVPSWGGTFSHTYASTGVRTVKFWFQNLSQIEQLAFASSGIIQMNTANLNNFTSLKYFSVYDNYLNLPTIDSILSKFTVALFTSVAPSILALYGGGNAVPTPAIKAAAIAYLTTSPKNWTVYTN